MNPKYADPYDISDGGGSLYDETWVKVLSAKTEITQKFSKPTPVINLSVQELNGGETHEELFMIGNADNWEVDGKWMMSKGGYKLSKNNAAGVILRGIADAGFQWDMTQMDAQGIAQLVGHWFFVQRYDLTNRDGEVLKNDKGFTKTGISFTKWGGNSAQPNEAAGGAAQATTQQAQAPAGADMPTQGVEAVIVAAITAANGALPAANVPTAVAMTPPAGFDLTQHIPNVAPGSAWLTDAARPWTINNGVLTAK